MRSVLISISLSSFICSWLASRCSQRSPSQQWFPWALQLKEQILKEQITDGCVFFKMPSDDGHDRCLQCLGLQHAEDAFVDDSRACCGRMSMTSLRSCLSFLKGLAPSATTYAGLSGSSRGPPAGALGDLRVTVRASGTSTWQMSEDVDKACFHDAPISEAGLFGDTVEGFPQQLSVVQQQTEAIQLILPLHDAPTTAAPGNRSQTAIAPAPRTESTPRPARQASRRWAASFSIPTRPQVVQEVVKVALTRATWRCWSLLFLRRQWEQRRSFPRRGAGRRIICFILFLNPLSQRKSNFPFLPGSQVHGTTVCKSMLPHSRPRPILPAAKRAQFGDAVPPHTPLASPIWDSGSLARIPQNAPAFCIVQSYYPSLHHYRYIKCTLKVYVAAIMAHHDAVDGRSLGKHGLIVRLMKGCQEDESL